MSDHHKAEYYIKADGTHVMSYNVFRKMKFEQLCKLLGIKGGVL